MIFEVQKIAGHTIRRNYTSSYLTVIAGSTSDIDTSDTWHCLSTDTSNSTDAFLTDPSPIIHHHTSAQSSHHTILASITLLLSPVTNAQSHYNIMRASADIAKLSLWRANMSPYHGVLCDRNICDSVSDLMPTDVTRADDVIRLCWVGFYDAMRELKLRC